MDLFISQKDISALLRIPRRQLLKQCINASYSVIGTYMVWKLIGCLLNVDSPISVVLSESMSPGFERGDIIWLRSKQDVTTGDITVFQLYKDAIPIVHRTIKKFNSRVLTKGDNNNVDDVNLYRPNQYYLEPSDIKASIFVYIPYFGMMTIWINTIPALRYVILSVVSFSVFLTRD